MIYYSEAWKDRSVFLTGHTGFKGGWLTLLLLHLGAKVSGFSLDPEAEPNFFTEVGIDKVVSNDIRGDIRDYQQLLVAMQNAKPTIVYHLAAQALVRRSYQEPLATLTTNVIGTANILEAAKHVSTVKAVVVITTDKVYKNIDLITSYKEDDILGGYDVYSASKSAAELVVDSFRQSFFELEAKKVNVATVRAGNVIGGGDWALDRLIPDCVNNLILGKAIQLRYPNATRPWQHVLEPLSGYLLLGEKLLSQEGNQYCSAWNFGPSEDDQTSVMLVAKKLVQLWGKEISIHSSPQSQSLHEEVMLKLDSSKAAELLLWRPVWDLSMALKQTINWYLAWHDKKDVYHKTNDQIQEYLLGMSQKVETYN